MIERFDQILEQALLESDQIEGLAIVDNEGVILTCALPENIDAERVVSICVSIYRACQTASEELDRGAIKSAYVEGLNGFIFFTIIDETLVLISLARKGALLGTVFNEVKQLTFDLIENA